MKRFLVYLAILVPMLVLVAGAPVLVGAPLAASIDPRAYWLHITNANTLPRYEVTDIGYQDESQSGGNVNVYVQVLDELGRPCFGCRVRFNTSDGQNEAVQTVINGATDFPQSGDSSFAPDRGESGPYFVEVAGAASDRVSGMGLPLRRHVVYQIRFQKVVNGTPPTATPLPTHTPVPGQTVTPQPGGLTENDVRRIIDHYMLEKFGTPAAR